MMMLKNGYLKKLFKVLKMITGYPVLGNIEHYDKFILLLFIQNRGNN